MSEHDDTLRKTLKEVTRLRSEREESLREIATNEYSGRLRYAERVYWLYGIACVTIGVAAINFFARSFDIKTLIGCAVVMIVIYETTVLMKLWFATARMKMDTLKEMKLLRLEVARLGMAAGVEQPSQPPVKYEPMPGMPRLERAFWLAACVIVAAAVSSWTSHAWFGGRDMSTETLVTLAADGSAEKLQDTDTDSVFDRGKMRYTQVLDVPTAAKLEDGVWTYQESMHHDGRDTAYSITILLPPGATLLSADPTAAVKLREDGRTHLRYQGTAKDNKKYNFTVRYELSSKSEQDE